MRGGKQFIGLPAWAVLLLAGCPGSSTPATPATPPPPAPHETPAAEPPATTAPPDGGTNGQSDRAADPPGTTNPGSPSALEPLSGGRPLRQWLAEAVSPDQATRQAANGHLDRQGSRINAELVAALKDNSPEVRCGAAFMLVARLDPDDEAMVGGMIAALGDSDRRVRGMAVQAVGQMRPEMASAAVPRLMGMLADPREDALLRANVARLLGRLGEHGREAFPTLVEVLDSGADRGVRTACLLALAKTAPGSNEAIKAYARTMRQDAEAPLRRLAADRLAGMGPAAAPAIGDLLATLEDADNEVRLAAASAVGRIGRPAIAPLVALAKDRKPSAVRVLAIHALGEMGTTALPALGDIQALMNDPDPHVRRAAEVAALRVEGQL
jgi:HEAT repeat protein